MKMLNNLLAKRKQRQLIELRKAWAAEQGFPVSQCGGSCKQCNGPRCPYYKRDADSPAPEVPRRAA